MTRLERHGLQVDSQLAAFSEDDALLGTDVTPDQFLEEPVATGS